MILTFGILFIIPSARPEPVTIAVAVGGLCLAGFGYLFRENVKSVFSENCKIHVKTPDYSKIQDEIFGQPVALSLVPPMFQQHISDPNPSRAILYYFLGWSGTGKTYLSTVLLNKIYPEFDRNRKSKFVTTFTGTHYTGNFNKHRQDIMNTINEKLKACPRSAFIFDEIDNFPPKFMDFLSGYVNSAGSNGIEHNRAIFILLGYVLFSYFLEKFIYLSIFILPGTQTVTK